MFKRYAASFKRESTASMHIILNFMSWFEIDIMSNFCILSTSDSNVYGMIGTADMHISIPFSAHRLRQFIVNSFEKHF